MSTLAFRAFTQPAPRRTTAAEPSSGLRPFHFATGILATIAALGAMVALVVIMRLGIYTLGHADQPFFRLLIDRLAS
jgi:hypothetical protein